MMSYAKYYGQCGTQTSMQQHQVRLMSNITNYQFQTDALDPV